MSKNFLECFKAYESAVKFAGYESALAYEQSLPEGDKTLGRLRLCRQCRNFVAHESDGFFEGTDKMCDFLLEMATKFGEGYTPVKKLQRKAFVTDTMPIQKAAELVMKIKAQVPIPVANKQGEIVGCFGKEEIILFAIKNNVNSQAKVGSAMRTGGIKGMFPTVLDSTLKKDVPEGCFCLVSDGSKITGWI